MSIGVTRVSSFIVACQRFSFRWVSCWPYDWPCCKDHFRNSPNKTIQPHSIPICTWECWPFAIWQHSIGGWFFARQHWAMTGKWAPYHCWHHLVIHETCSPFGLLFRRCSCSTKAYWILNINVMLLWCLDSCCWFCHFCQRRISLSLLDLWWPNGFFTFRGRWFRLKDIPGANLWFESFSAWGVYCWSCMGLRLCGRAQRNIAESSFWWECFWSLSELARR